MKMSVRIIDSEESPKWDDYVRNHSGGTLYHLSGWRDIIRKSYGHKTYYLASFEEIITEENQSDRMKSEKLTGIFPIVYLNNYILGKNLISVPFFDIAGVLADDIETEKELVARAILIGEKLRVKGVEFRHNIPLSWMNYNGNGKAEPDLRGMPFSPSKCINVQSHKVRMLLDLPDTSEELMKSFKSKLRSQIKKPVKSGLRSVIGGKELLNDFYHVFSVNMRDLGSPVHSKSLMSNVMDTFPESSRIVMIYKEMVPVSCGIIIGFGDTMENPWASTLREFNHLSPNMLLYWSMLEYSCENGFKYFDFGRSTPSEGTYRFKSQWGAKPQQLYWYNYGMQNSGNDINDEQGRKRLIAEKVWKKLPLSMANIIGPKIRKYIGL